MKLAEALLERKEKLKKMERLQEEIKASVVTTDEKVEAEDIDSLLGTLTNVSNEVEELNIKISKANAEHQAENLAKIQQLDKMISFYKDVRNKILNPRDQRAFWGENVSFNKNYNHKAITSRLEELEKQRTNTDREMTRLNWQIDI
jgi:hypothetical protein